MITVNMHEAKSKLLQLLAEVEEHGEVIVIYRSGKPVAEIKAIQGSMIGDRFTPDPALKVTFAPGFNPVEPATEKDWPEENRLILF